MNRRGDFRGRLLSAIAVVSLGAALVAAAEPSPTVDEIVARYVAARGGLKKLESIQSLRQQGHLTAGAGRRALLTRELKRPGRIRFAFTVQGVTAVYISDGKQGWQVSPFEGDMTPQPLPDEVLVDAIEQTDIEGPLVGWKDKGHRVALVGREVIDGREAYKLEITLKSGTVRYEYLDAKSYRQIRSETTRQLRGRSVQLEISYADFKKTNGILFPRRIEVRPAGRPDRSTVVVEKIEVNPPLPDALFELAKPAQP